MVDIGNILSHHYVSLGKVTDIMNHLDEVYINAMNAYKKGTYGTLEEGIYILEENVEFVRIDLFDNRLNMMVPKKFFDMPLNIAKLKYPTEQRPQIIKTNENYDINLTFSLLNVELKNENVYEVRDGLKNILQNIQPSIVVQELGGLKRVNFDIAWFDFKSPAADAPLYNIMYCISLDNQLMQGVFNCPYVLKELWNPVFLQLLNSIQISKNGQEGD